MSDTAYPVFQHYGTAAQRAAFTPSPAAGTQPIYIWYETDTDDYYIYTTAWKGPFNDDGTGAITALTGDVTATGPGSVAATIANNAVSDAKLRDSAAVSVLGRSANSSGDPADIVAAANDRVLARTGDTVAFQQLTVGMHPADTITGAKLTVSQRTRAVALIIGDRSNVITTGVKFDIRFPVAGTITKVTLLADQSGSIVVDLWKDTYANYPPTVADTITAAAKPTLSAAVKSEDSTLTGWTTSITAGDTLRGNVDSVATVTQVMLLIEFVVTV